MKKNAFFTALLLTCIFVGCDGGGNSGSSEPEPEPEPGTVSKYKIPEFPESLGEQKVAVILLRTNDMKPITVEPERYVDAIFGPESSMASFIDESSGGRTTLTGEVFGWYEIDAFSNCDRLRIEDSGLARLTEEARLSDFNRFLFIYPSPSENCRFPAGWAIPGLRTLNTPEGNISASTAHIISEGYVPPFPATLRAATIAHEFLHNLGVWHANAYDCGDQVFGSTASCQMLEYGNNFSIMGQDVWSYHPDGFHKMLLGWLDPSQIGDGSKDSQFVLTPISHTTARNETLTIRIPLKEYLEVGDTYGEKLHIEDLFVDYRDATGFDQRQITFPGGIPDGVRIYGWAIRTATAVSGTPEAVTILLDMTPESQQAESPDQTTNFTDTADGFLALGQTYFEPVNGISITYTGKDDISGYPIVRIEHRK